jgi:transposase
MKPRAITLDGAQDGILQRLVTGKGIAEKVKLRAEMVRLVAQGWPVAEVAIHFGRCVQTVHDALSRYETDGICGLPDKESPQKRGKFTPEIVDCIQELIEQDRTWNCRQISEVIESKFGITISDDRIGAKLKELGYSWKRCRYVPMCKPSQVVEDRFKESLETLKRGLATGS